MRRTSVFYRWALALVGVASALLVSYQSSFAQDVEDATREACRPEALRLCAVYIPDVEQITKCMTERIAEVSPQCRAAMIKEDKRARARLPERRDSSLPSAD